MFEKKWDENFAKNCEIHVDYIFKIEKEIRI